jgi:hypothetical protein
MNVSERNFLACQALYGLMNAVPTNKKNDGFNPLSARVFPPAVRTELIREAYEFADEMMEQPKRKASHAC